MCTSKWPLPPHLKTKGCYELMIQNKTKIEDYPKASTLLMSPISLYGYTVHFSGEGSRVRRNTTLFNETRLAAHPLFHVQN